MACPLPVSLLPGLCALCPLSANTVLVCPGLQKGHVRCELYDAKKTTLIEAHETALAAFALNSDGSRLATASETGTLIRIFDTASGAALQEVRRGADKAEIYSIAFNPTSAWLACSSDRGTIHIFALRTGGATSTAAATAAGGSGGAEGGGGGGGGAAVAHNPTSSLSFMKTLLPKYFSSEWSFAQFRVPDVRTIVAFGGEKNSIVVASAAGLFYKALFDPERPGHEAIQDQVHTFTKQPQRDAHHSPHQQQQQQHSAPPAAAAATAPAPTAAQHQP